MGYYLAENIHLMPLFHFRTLFLTKYRYHFHPHPRLSYLIAVQGRMGEKKEKNPTRLLSLNPNSHLQKNKQGHNGEHTLKGRW